MWDPESPDDVMEYAAWYLTMFAHTGKAEPNMEPETADRWRADHAEMEAAFARLYPLTMLAWMERCIESGRVLTMPRGLDS